MQSKANIWVWRYSALLGAALLGLTSAAEAATCYAVSTANWNVASTWSATSAGIPATSPCLGNGAVTNTPGAADTVNIGETATARTVTIPTGVNISATSVTLGITAGAASANALTLLGNGSLAVSGALTVNKPGANNLTNALNVDAGTVTAGSVTLGGATTTASRIANIRITTGTLTISGDLTFITGVAGNNVLNMSGDAGTVNLGGAFTATVGTLTPGTTSTFNYNGSASAQTVLINVSSIAYNNLHANNTNAGGATLSAAITATNVTGNVRVQSGILNNGGFAIAGNAAKTFEVASGATFRMTAAAFPTVFGTFTFGPTSTVRYLQANAQTISTQTYGHLEVSPSANTITHTFAAGTTTVAGNLTAGNGTNTGVVVTAASNSTTLNVSGSVTISANTTLVAHASNPFTVGGNWTNNGAFTASGGTVTFNGTAAQAIGGSATTSFNTLVINNTAGVTTSVNLSVSGNFTNTAGFNAGTTTTTFNGTTAQTLGGSATTFYNLVFNNAAGFTLNFDMTASNTLTLTSGVVTTGANTLIFSSTASCSVTRTSGHINGNLRKNFTASLLTCNFEIGDAANYTPVAVTFTSLTAAGSLTASTTTPDHPQIASSSINPAKSVNRYWTLISTITGIYDATFTFVVGDVDAGADTSNFIVQRYASSTWFNTTFAAANPTSTSASGINGFGDFAIGEPIISGFLLERELIYIREVYD